MVTIYGIEVLRVKGEDRPVLSIAEATETPKFYMIESGDHGFLDYRTRIDKTRADLSFSPRHAWEQYIQRCNLARASLRFREQEISGFQRYAIGQLANLSEGEA